ncbi:MAG TPA: hypothetical protein VH479_25730 [Acidimicrobiales bacterium]
MSDTIPTAEQTGGPGAQPDEAPRSARILVAILFVLLLVPGLIGFDAWPLTGWRLFSKSRGPEVTRWVIEAVEENGSRRVVSLEELPLRYRHAEWPMSELPGASEAKRTAVCEALLAPVRDILPHTEQLVIARDHARLIEGDDGHWITTHDLEPFHSCTWVDGT